MTTIDSVIREARNRVHQFGPEGLGLRTPDSAILREVYPSAPTCAENCTSRDGDVCYEHTKVRLIPLSGELHKLTATYWLWIPTVPGYEKILLHTGQKVTPVHKRFGIRFFAFQEENGIATLTEHEEDNIPEWVILRCLGSLRHQHEEAGAASA